MKESDIRKYAELMKELELTGLEITEKDQVVRLERAIPAGTKEQIILQQPAPATASDPVSAAASVSAFTGSEAPHQGEAGDYISVTSPIVGVFYAAPAENAEAYVSIGSPVKKGDVLCVIEAMKLMNEIAAEEPGVISQICVTNGQVVEYGTELFRIARKQEAAG